MANGPIDQSGQGSAAERRLCLVAARYSVARGNAAPIARVRPLRAASLPVSGGGGSSGSAGRGLRSYGPDHAQASCGNGKSSSGLCEKKWPDDWNNRDTCVGGVSACSEKAWLSRAQDTARFKFSLTIRLIACTTRKSPKPTVFWCLFGSVPSAAV
jgi:hypothetical protein